MSTRFPGAPARRANGGTAAGFDALAAVRALEKAGVERRQAETHAEIVANAVGGGNSATKADLEAGLARLEARLTVRLYGGLFAGAALIAALKLFP